MTRLSDVISESHAQLLDIVSFLISLPEVLYMYVIVLWANEIHVKEFYDDGTYRI